MGSYSDICDWNALKYDPGRIVQVKTKEFCSSSECVGFVRSRNGAKQRAELSTIENICKTLIGQMNLELQSPEWCCGKGLKVGECAQCGAHGHFSKGDSCSFSHDPKVPGNNGKGQWQKKRSSSPTSTRRRNRLTARDKIFTGIKQ